MKVAVLALFLLGAASAADTTEAQDELVEVFGAESADEDADAASRRRRRRWGHRHRPHGHWPHGHNPHWHHPHAHSPHAHSDCIQAGNERTKVQFLKDDVEKHKKKKEHCQQDLDALSNELPDQGGYGTEIPALVETEYTYDEETHASLVQMVSELKEVAETGDSDDADAKRLENEAKIEIKEACIAYHGDQMESKNEKIQNIKKKLRQNDCTDTVRWISNAAEAVAKWIEALVEFLLTFKCLIIDIAVKVVAGALDGFLAANPATASTIAMLKSQPWCFPAFSKPKKGGAPPASKPTPSPKMKKFFYVVTWLTFVPQTLTPTPIEVFKWFYTLWQFIVVLIDDDKLTAIAEEVHKVVYFVLLIWTALCGSLFGALLTLGKDIMYCNVPAIGCPCPNAWLKF